MSLSLDLAERYASIGPAALPDAAIRAACVSLADGLAVMLAAAGLEPAAAAFAEHALAFEGRPEATLLGRPGRAPAPLAALANGALAHAIDFEDTYDRTGMHPNAATIPAVLALAERDNADGAAVIRALALGCDFTCRLSDALASDPATRGWYHPPMLGTMGATLAAALLLDLDPPRIVDALALAASQFSLGDELKRSPHSHLRAVRDGLAARAAVEAVLLARRGVRGAERPLEGPAGLFGLLTGLPPDGRILFDRIGDRLCGTEVTIKRWPSCRGTHAAIEAALTLHAEGVAPDSITEVRFAVSPPDDMLFDPIEQKQHPATAIDAKFSIPFTFAAALTGGSVDLASFSNERLRAPEVLSVAGRVRLERVVEGGDETIALSIAGQPHLLPLVLPRGDSAATITSAALAAKVSSCVAHAPELVDAQRLVNACLALPEAGLRPVLDALANGNRRS